jgi:hypothetical protein
MRKLPSGLYLYGVDVEVVEGLVGVLGRRAVRLFYTDVVEAVPLEEHLPTSKSRSWAIPPHTGPSFGPTYRGEVHFGSRCRLLAAAVSCGVMENSCRSPRYPSPALTRRPRGRSRRI